ncbi:MAG: AAA family ATPase [Pirellulales bacterium]|nr:AAA family ATPase [Pirellulales bacterium]
MTDRQASDSSPRPFVTVPHPSRYFPATVFEEARQRITRSIQRGEGPALLIGGAGIGKTMLLEVLAQQFRSSITIAPLAGAQLCTRRALLQMVLFQVGLPYRGLDEGELRLSLLNHLRPENASPRRLLLLVDEAESLPDRLLEELRVLTNIADEGQSLVSLVLVGNFTLEERFAEPKLQVFSQRISSRSYLAPLGREETLQYIRAQIAAVGQDPQTLFSEDGLEAMFATTDGVPRLINQLGNQLLWMADETGYAPLDAEIVQQAWSELQQLPAPWDAPPVEATGSPVEFGELELDDVKVFVEENHDEDMPASIPMNTSCRSDQLEDTIAVPLAETFDSTEDLLKQLSQMEQMEVKTTVESTAADSPVSNPFLEDFDSEEIVLDRYSTFENLLLCSAPKVLNQDDTTFAEQIQQFEVSVPAGIEEEEDHQLGSPCVETSKTGAVCQDVTSIQEETPTEIGPGELLIVEDETSSKVDVVPGKQFRQLFSSLQSDNSVPCYG